jgi:hypothetical protein
MNTEIYRESLEILRKLLDDVIKEKGITVYLFGSRAKGSATAVSDIDIGIVAPNRDISKLLAFLREKIENSNIPYKIDIVDLSLVSEKFKQKALERVEVLWKS